MSSWETIQRPSGNFPLKYNSLGSNSPGQPVKMHAGFFFRKSCLIGPAKEVIETIMRFTGCLWENHLTKKGAWLEVNTGGSLLSIPATE